MSRHPEVLDFLRAEGLTVVEVNGWHTRGSEVFDPHGSVNHHTAAGAGQAPSLGICTNGRSDLPGPLCNVLQSRQVDANGLDVVYLVAAGRANHAGSGGWKGLAGNSKMWGLEIEHRGTSAEPFSAARLDTATRVHAAFARCSSYAASMVCQHHEWAPKRKIDFLAAEVEPGLFRGAVAARLAKKPAPAPAPAPTTNVQEDEDMDKTAIPSWGHFDKSGRVPFYLLAPGGTDTEFLVFSYNGAGLDRVDGTIGSPFLRQMSTTGRALGIEEHGGLIVVLCSGGGVYKVADAKSAKPK